MYVYQQLSVCVQNLKENEAPFVDILTIIAN